MTEVLMEDVIFAEKTGNCPCCDLVGVTDEEARKRNPGYMREIDYINKKLLPIATPLPPQTTWLCWGCRHLAHQSPGKWGRRARQFYALENTMLRDPKFEGHPCTYVWD